MLLFLKTFVLVNLTIFFQYLFISAFVAPEENLIHWPPLKVHIFNFQNKGSKNIVFKCIKHKIKYFYFAF